MRWNVTTAAGVPWGRSEGLAPVYDEAKKETMRVEHVDDIVVVELETELDANTAPRVKEELESAFGDQTRRVILDLSQLDFIDSAGLGVLVSLVKALRARGGDMRLVGLRDPVRMIFRLTRLDRVFKIFGDRGEALASYGGSSSGTYRRNGA